MAAGEVNLSVGTSLGGGGGGCWRHAGLAGAYTTWHTLAWLHVGSIIKGHQSAQAGREGLPCRAVAAAAALRLWLAWQPPAQGGRQVPHRVLHEELRGDRSDSCCVLCDLIQQCKGLWARATVRLVTQWYKTAGISAGAAVFVPRDCAVTGGVRREGTVGLGLNTCAQAGPIRPSPCNASTVCLQATVAMVGLH